MNLFIHFYFLQRTNFIIVLFCLLSDYHRHCIIDEANHLIFASTVFSIKLVDWEKPFSHWFCHLRFQFLPLLLFFRLWTREDMTRFILAEAIRNNSTIGFWHVLLFFLLLNHFFIDTVCNQFGILVTAVVVSYVFFLWIRICEIYFHLFYRKISKLKTTSGHVNTNITGFYLILYYLSLTYKFSFKIQYTWNILFWLIEP